MDMLTQQKIEIVVDMATKGMQSEIASLKQNIEGFQSEIAALRNELAGLRSQSFRPAPEQREPQQTLVQETRQKAAIDEPIDRNGVAPSTVSIEKMFYCGNKKF